MRKVNYILAICLSVFFIGCASKQQMFELEVTDIFFPLYDDEQNKKLLEEAANNVTIEGRYYDGTETKLEWQTCSWLGGSNCGVFAMFFGYPEFNTYDKNYKEREARNIEYLGGNKVRFELPLEELIEIRVSLSIKSVAEMLGFSFCYNYGHERRCALVRSISAYIYSRKGTFTDEYDYYTISNNNNFVFGSVTTKAKFKLSLVENNLTSETPLKIGNKANGSNSSLLSDRAKNYFLNIDTPDTTPANLQLPKGLKTAFKDTAKGIYSVIDEIKTETLDIKFDDVISAKWIKYDGKLKSVVFKYNIYKSSGYHYNIDFGESTSRFFVAAYDDNGVWLNDKDITPITQRQEKTIEYIGKRTKEDQRDKDECEYAFEYAKKTLILDRDEFEKEFLIYQNLIKPL